MVKAGTTRIATFKDINHGRFLTEDELREKYINRLQRQKERRSPAAGYQSNIEQETEGNTNFRRVLFTGPYSQLVVMNLKPGEDIGMETHERLDQFIRIEAGEGTSIIDGKERELKPGDGLVIPAGSAHNIIATTTLKLYAVYTKPEHPDKLIVKAKTKRLVVPALKRKRIGTNN